MNINKSEFLISVAEFSKCPDYGMLEIAVAGKSNVGKSSIINFLANRKGLAKTSSTPGRTRLLNYFKFNEDFILVDLPGYGYARVNDDEKNKWANLIEGYLLTNERMAHIFCIVDIRHEPTILDRQLLSFIQYHKLPYSVIATKSDKLSRMQIAKNRKMIADNLRMGVDNIYVVSSTEKTGKEKILERIEQVLENFNVEVEEDDEYDDVEIIVNSVDNAENDEKIENSHNIDNKE